MARESNNNPPRPRTNNHTTQHDNHSLTSTSTASQRCRITGSSSTSTHNDPGGTAMIHCSGTESSFNTYGKGSQDFRDATINSGSRDQNTTRSVAVGNSTCSGTRDSFNNRGSGSQDFQGAKINSGYNTGERREASISNEDNAGDHSPVTVESPKHFSGTSSPSRSPTTTSIIARCLNIVNSGNRRGRSSSGSQKFWEQDRVLHCSGTVHSFNNHGNGSQRFNGAKFNSGANSTDP